MMNTSSTPSVTALVRAHGAVWLRDRAGFLERLTERPATLFPDAVATAEQNAVAGLQRARMDQIEVSP